MIPGLGPIIGAAGGIIGGLISSRSTANTNAANAKENRKTRKWTAREQRAAEQRLWKREDQVTKRTNPRAIRRKAEKAGFNPLLFTGAAFQGGATGSATAATPAFGTPMQASNAGALVASGFQSAAQQYSEAESLALQKSQLEMENERLSQIARDSRFGTPDTMYSGWKSSGSSLADPEDNEGLGLTQTADQRPRPRKAAYEEMVPAYAPNKQLIQVPKSGLEALGKSAFDTLMMGDMAEIFGEGVGEVLGTYGMPEILETTGYDPTQGGPDRQPGQFSFGPLGGVSWDWRSSPFYKGYSESSGLGPFGSPVSNGANGAW